MGRIAVALRTGLELLETLRGDGREVWIDGERVADVTADPRFAGAARELKSALIVNPYDTDEVAEAMARGLEMPLDERLNRREAMMKVIHENDLDNWRDKYLAALADAGRKA